MSEDFVITDYSPWVKPVGRLATLARRQALTGLKPIGPHAELAGRLLKDITGPCGTCHGSGLHGTYGGLGWRACPDCHGLGETYRISPEELQARRQRVLDRYPDAALQNWAPGHPIRCPLLNIGTGEIIDACALDVPEPVQLELPF